MPTTATIPAVSYTTVNDGDAIFGQVTLGGEPLELWLAYEGNPLHEDDIVDEIVIDVDGNIVHAFDHNGATPTALHNLIVGLVEQGLTHRARCSEGR